MVGTAKEPIEDQDIWLIRNLKQLRMALAILWLDQQKRKEFPGRPGYWSMTRLDIIDRANKELGRKPRKDERVNHGNLKTFIENLIRSSIVDPIYEYNGKTWRIVLLTEEGRRRLRARVRAYLDDWIVLVEAL